MCIRDRCNGDLGSASASAAGGTGSVSLDWGGADENALSAGTYTVTATDDNGCTATADATVSEPSAVSIVTTTFDPACYGESTGQANITMSGGVSPYTLEIWTLLPVFGWTPYVVLQTDTLEIVGTSPTGNWDPTGLIGPAGTLYSGPYAPAGDYYGVMTDANGCTVTSATETISNPAELTVSALSLIHI